MVEIVAAYANARLNTSSDTKSNPTVSPLLAGTFDYIKGTQKIDNSTYYMLTSGKRIKSSDLKEISKGYKLPLNRLRASSKMSGGALEMSFGVDWKMPFSVDLTGQKYTSSEGFAGYAHGVSSYNATGITITFYHTDNYSGSVNASSFPLAAAAEWSRNTSEHTVTLKITLKNAGKFYGYKATYKDNKLVISLRPKPPATLKGADIWIDAGHGGSDSGAPYAASHATYKSEKYFTLSVATRLKKKLEAAGANVYMTRTSDLYVSPAERVRMTRDRNPDLFISVHSDSSETSSPSGTSAFYYKAYGQPLAKAVQASIVQAYKNSIYISGNGISNYSDMRSRVDRGAKFYPFEVCRIEECPAILVEYGFGSNLTECRVLQSETYQNILAQATVDGISVYLRNAQ